ncbi:hypothetical protein HMPREF1051_2135 [Neisseria sicca VK64]|uniref:Uncharacterized protein n=1 Tax=Neisseria sicca VK64 TaxID=1095748 RepID=I2NVU5_NEISI|nr:hypothetical protein HMPREF1051_2135 [Neisseria sicca VK64]
MRLDTHPFSDDLFDEYSHHRKPQTKFCPALFNPSQLCFLMRFDIYLLSNTHILSNSTHERSSENIFT